MQAGCHADNAGESDMRRVLNSERVRRYRNALAFCDAAAAADIRLDKLNRALDKQVSAIMRGKFRFACRQRNRRFPGQPAIAAPVFRLNRLFKPQDMMLCR